MSHSAAFLATAGAEQIARRTGEALLNIRGHLCNLNDGLGSGGKSIIYTPTAISCWYRERQRFKRWMDEIIEHGGTHLHSNLPDGGPSYNGIWDQPDIWSNLGALREFALEVTDGYGLSLTWWMDHGGSDPLPRIQKNWPKFAETLEDLLPHMIGFPGCEPVVGDWSSREASEALKLQYALMPSMPMGWHGSPTRWVASSNPLERDDPWQGGEASWAYFDGAEHVQIYAYQTEHGRMLYEVCDNDHSKAETFDKGPHGEPEPCTCWLSRWRDGVMRYGTGFHYWREMKVCLFETTTYEYIRGEATSEDARDVATWGQRIVDWWAPGLDLGFGNGLPQ